MTASGWRVQEQCEYRGYVETLLTMTFIAPTLIAGFGWWL